MEGDTTASVAVSFSLRFVVDGDRLSTPLAMGRARKGFMLAARGCSRRWAEEALWRKGDKISQTLLIKENPEYGDNLLNTNNTTITNQNSPGEKNNPPKMLTAVMLARTREVATSRSGPFIEYKGRWPITRGANCSEGGGGC